MILSLGFSSRGVWVRYFMQSWFPFVPTPQSPALCHICLLCPLQSYLVSGGPSGSLSYPALSGPRIPLPWPPVFLGRMQRMYQGTQGTQSLQPFWASSRGGATNYLLGAAMVRLFCTGSIRSFHPEALSRSQLSQQGSHVGFLSDWLVWSPCCIRDSRIFTSTTVLKLNSSAFTLSYGPDHTSVHDYWKNHSFDTKDLCSKGSLCFLIHCAGLSQHFFLQRSKYLLIFWLQSRSIMVLEPKKMKSATVPTFSPSICH